MNKLWLITLINIALLSPNLYGQSLYEDSKRFKTSVLNLEKINNEKTSIKQKISIIQFWDSLYTELPLKDDSLVQIQVVNDIKGKISSTEEKQLLSKIEAEIPFDSLEILIKVDTFLQGLQAKVDTCQETLKTLQVNTYAPILASLNHYQKSSNKEIEITEWETFVNQIRLAYENNLEIKTILKSLVWEDLYYENQELIDSFNTNSKRLQKGPRSNILDHLNAGFAISPIDYLTIDKTLQDYSSPTLPEISVLKEAATKVNKNIDPGSINEVAILVGLFNFLLDRAGEEIVITFLERLLGENGIAQFSILFPSVVDAYANRDFTYSNSFLQRLRDAFYQDLQSLSLNLPSLLLNTEYFNIKSSDPVLFNFLQVYTMLGLAQQNRPIEEILPLTFRNLNEQYREDLKAFNLNFAKDLQSLPEFGALAISAQNVVDQTSSLNQLAREYRRNIQDDAFDLYTDYFSGNSNHEVTQRDSIHLENIIDEVLDTSNYNLFTAWRNAQSLGQENDSLPLFLLPSLLMGNFDLSLTRGWSTLETYDRYLRNPPESQVLRSTGLALAQKISKTAYPQSSLTNYIRSRIHKLHSLSDSLLRFQHIIDPQVKLNQAYREYLDNKAHLGTVLQICQDNLSQQNNTEKQILLSLEVLERILNDPLYYGKIAQDSLEEIRLGQKEIRDIERRLNELNQRFPKLNTSPIGPGPITSYFSSTRSQSPIEVLEEQIDLLDTALKNLHDKLLDLQIKTDSIKLKDASLKAITPMLQLSEVASHLFYCFRSASPAEGKDSLKWLTFNELETVLYDQNLRDIFLGFLAQQLRQSSVEGEISVPHLVNFIRQVIRDLGVLTKSTQPEKDEKISTSSQFF